MGNKERYSFFRPNYEKDTLVVGHHQGVLGQIGVPYGVH
jgi:hypothetical protein